VLRTKTTVCETSAPRLRRCDGTARLVGAKLPLARECDAHHVGRPTHVRPATAAPVRKTPSRLSRSCRKRWLESSPVYDCRCSQFAIFDCRCSTERRQAAQL